MAQKFLRTMKEAARRHLPEELRRLKRFAFRIDPRNYRAFNFIPFDLSKPQPTGAIEKLAAFLADAGQRGLTVRPSDGTLLGLIRDGRLIPHDNDLDFDLIYSREALSWIADYAKQHQWIVGREVAYRGTIQQVAYFDPDQQIFDFVFWEKYQSNYLNFGEKPYIRVQPAMFFEQLSLQDVAGVSFHRPTNIEAWLEHRYGPRWSVPDSAKPESFVTDCGDLVPRSRI